ncbi:protein of unknown function [Nitrospira japonica]|uniref:Uncharacterized protein n=1 Tax=Nitrospira japonica TaxID=1325564 RepID=A0A1W1I644_9BACT|nr:protein of unknown function [Nitrospira japonica]
MTPWRRWISIGYFASAFMAVIYVPWVQHDTSYQFYEYAFIFNPPQFRAEIAYGIVILEILAISLVASALFIFEDILEPRVSQWIAEAQKPPPPLRPLDPLWEKNWENVGRRLGTFYRTLRQKSRTKRS